jgi:hypothetical protein
MAKRKRQTAKSRTTSSTPKYHLEPELVVIARPDAGLRAAPSGLASIREVDTAPLNRALNRHNASLRPLFGASEERLMATMATHAAADVPDLATYYRVDAPPERLDDLAAELRRNDAVEAAYVKPPAEPPQINDMLPSPEAAPPATPDFGSRQGYLDAAPGGINARFAWTVAGGRGGNVRIIDIEGAWRFSHEDLMQNQGGVVGGTPSPDIGWRNHGTAVIGEFGGDTNTVGVSGICPDANTSAISIFGGPGSAGALTAAANRLQAGDIILIELHRPGPRNNFQNRNDQHGYIAIEWWPDDFAAIRFATSRGIIVVEAAGNGAQNLDDPIYNTRPPGFPAAWRNPFNRSNPDCGAVIVGAGAPPPGTHGRNHGPDRSRLDFSNFGACVDVQGWGREVTTCGYGDLQGGTNEDLWYTDTFSGTSSASPIIVGALGSLQGITRARGLPLITPARARNLLRTTGSAQTDAPGRPRTQRIGNRPDLRALIAAIGGKGALKDAKEKDFKEPKELKEPKEFKDTKDARKDIKDKEKEKDKEKDVKEPKELKDLKEIRKEIKEKDLKEKDFKEPKERDKDLIDRPEQAGSGDDIQDRLARVEQTLSHLAHFIGADLRPDLSASALYNEGDRGDLERQAQDAKGAKDTKDAKDVDKVSER